MSADATNAVATPQTTAVRRLNFKPDDLLSAGFLAQLSTLTMMSRKIISGKLRGERRTQKRGNSLEFADFKSYTQGDDLRHIDWAAFGRLEKLFIKLFHEEDDLSVYVLLDNSLSMGIGEPNKSAYARRIAAALLYIALMQGDRASVFTRINDADFSIRDQRGRGRVLNLFRFLCDLPIGGATDLDTLAARFVTTFKRPGLCIFVSDLMDPAGIEAAVRRLSVSKMDLFVVHILAPTEIDPVLSGEWRLMDVETGSPVDISASPRLIEQYRDSLRRFCVRAKDICANYSAHYLFSTTATSFENLILHYLRRMGLLS